MRIFVINLAKDLERKASIQNQADELGLTIEFVEAVNGKELSISDINLLSPGFHQSGMTLGELGCSLSHIKIYEKIIRENIELALILEDDAKLSDQILLVCALIKKYNSRRMNKSIVYLLSKTNEYIDTLKTKLSKEYSLANVIDADYTYGYIVNNTSAKMLLNFLKPVWIEADKWRFVQMNGIVKLKAVIPNIIDVTPLSYQSTLEKDRADNVQKRLDFFDEQYKKRGLKIKVKNLIWRLFIRSWVKRVK